MKRPALATAVILSAALATAGCANGQAPAGAAGAPSSAESSPNGSQSYTTMADLYAAVDTGDTHCTDATMQPTTVAKAEVACDLGSGQKLVLQTWRDSASRDQGIERLAATRATTHAAYCVIKGVGEEALWSVDASDNAGVCHDIAARLGGQVLSDATAASGTAATSAATTTAGSH